MNNELNVALISTKMQNNGQKKNIFNFFYYIQTMINVLIIFLHNIFKEK